MNIIILGTGVIGITAAYELIKDGHNVTLIDRQPEPALETSYGNAGLIAPGHSYAWTTPKLPKNLISSFIKKNQNAFKFTFQWDPAMWRWGVRFLMQCTEKKMLENTLRKYRLSIYSQKLLHKILDETNIEFHRNTKGLIYIFRTKESFMEGKEKLKILKPLMKGLHILTLDELINLEPILKQTNSKIWGGIYSPNDESGNCRDFTVKLTNICKMKGATFHFNTNIENIEKNKNKIVRVITDKGDYSADNYVLSCASYSPIFAKMIGEYLPIYPVKGYSITAPIINFDKAPIHSGIDEDNFLAFSTMGNKIRFTSVAEISGYDTSSKPSDYNKIIKLADLLFNNAFDLSKIEYWSGLRPMTPNGSPIIGRGNTDNMFFNTGHGHLGWTMCAGSAKILSNLIANKNPDIDLNGMTLNTL